MSGDNFYLFTSISPHLGGAELEHQKYCITSWRSAGFKVTTVNGRSEVARIAALELDVEILTATQDDKPLVLDILSCIAAKECRYAGIINADCALLPYQKPSKRLIKHLDNTLVLAERVDVDDLLIPQPDSCGGFDAFFFDTAVLPSDFCATFRIGVPWWDYYLPIAVAAQGGRVVNLITPFLMHRVHKRSWTGDERQRMGQEFWRFLKRCRASKPELFSALGPEVEALVSEETLTVEQLAVVGSACFRWLQNRQFDPPPAFLAHGMESIEILLRSMRLALRRNAEAQARAGEVQTRLFSKEAEAAEAQAKLVYKEAEAAEAQAKLVYKEAEAAEAQAKLVCKEAEATEAQAKLLYKEAEAASLSADNWLLKSKLAAIEQSNCWRMTKPLRQIVDILRAHTTRRETRA
jgi:hypothetical protein